MILEMFGPPFKVECGQLLTRLFNKLILLNESFDLKMGQKWPQFDKMISKRFRQNLKKISTKS